MFDIAWSEMLVLVVIAIIVIGPKDLPKVMRSVGGWMRKARALASEFRIGMDDLAREADLEDIRKNAELAANFDPNQTMKKALDPEGEIADIMSPPTFNDDLDDDPDDEDIATNNDAAGEELEKKS